MAPFERFSDFLETFPTNLHHRQPESHGEQWVFWSQYEGSHHSCSADVDSRMFYEKIKSAFSKVIYHSELILQFWAPVTSSSRCLLLTSGQPFAVNNLDNDLKKYRLCSVDHQYNIDVNLLDTKDEVNSKIRSGGPAAAFLNRMPEFARMEEHQESPLARCAFECGFKTSLMLPICSPFQTSSCIGVVECTIRVPSYDIVIFKTMKRALKEEALSICPIQECVPYKIIDGLKPVKNEIEEALKIVCKSHNIALAQVWIPFEDESYVFFSSSLEDTRKKQLLALKLTDYVVDKDSMGFHVHCFVKKYNEFCDAFVLKSGEFLVANILQDYEPRFDKFSDKLNIIGFLICLRSMDTDEFCYAFEFLWLDNSNTVIFLEALLLTLKRCLPTLKLASGAQIGDELKIINVDNSTNEIRTINIFQGNKLPRIHETLENGKKPMVKDYIPPPEVRFKTAPILLPREAIEQQFGNTMKEAATNLNVSLSTLKHKCKVFGISEWRGPSLVKRKVKIWNKIQSDPNEEDDRVTQGPSVVNTNENTITIKAECKDDIIKLHLHISQATFVHVEKEIGKKLRMTPGSYKLKYLDEDEDWILVISDQDIRDCIRSSRNLGHTVVRLLVEPFT